MHTTFIFVCIYAHTYVYINVYTYLHIYINLFIYVFMSNDEIRKPMLNN